MDKKDNLKINTIEDEELQDDMNNKEEKEKDNKRAIILLILYILSLLLFLLSGAFTLSTILKEKSTNINNIQVGEVRMDLINNNTTNINLLNAYPMTDEGAMKLKPFEFKVTNEGTLAIMYRIKLVDVKKEEVKIELPEEELPKDKVSYSLIDKDTKIVVKTGKISDLEDGIIITEKLQPKYTKSYDFRIWVNDTAGDESVNKYYITKISLEIDEILK